MLRIIIYVVQQTVEINDVSDGYFLNLINKLIQQNSTSEHDNMEVVLLIILHGAPSLNITSTTTYLYFFLLTIMHF